MSLFYELTGEFAQSDFIITDLVEAGGWTIGRTKAFKRGLKKYGNDQRVMTALKQIETFVTSHNQMPMTNSFPAELYVHRIRADDRFPKDTLWAHLKGQKIGLIFSMQKNMQLNLIALGTHQDMGWR